MGDTSSGSIALRRTGAASLSSFLFALSVAGCGGVPASSLQELRATPEYFVAKEEMPKSYQQLANCWDVSGTRVMALGGDMQTDVRIFTDPPLARIMTSGRGQIYNAIDITPIGPDRSLVVGHSIPMLREFIRITFDRLRNC